MVNFFSAKVFPSSFASIVKRKHENVLTVILISILYGKSIVNVIPEIMEFFFFHTIKCKYMTLYVGVELAI